MPRWSCSAGRGATVSGDHGPGSPSDLSLRLRLRRALIGGGAALLLLVVAATVSLGLIRDRQSAILDVLFVAISEADTGHIALLDAESSVRAYLETGNPVVLESFERLGASDQETDVEALLVDELGSGHPAIIARAEVIEDAETWYRTFAEPAIAAVASGGTGAVTAVRVAEGARDFAELDAAMRAYADLLRDERIRVVGDLDAATNALTAVFTALVMAALASGVLLWVFLQRWVTRPLTTLADDVRQVVSGDTGHAVTATGPGEVGAVAEDIEEMRARLTLLLAEAARTSAELEASHAVLAEQAEDLRRSNRDLEQFAYVASHDLQEPLRKVASFTQLLATRYAGQLDERADQYIGFAVDGATRMQRLVSDLLDFSRVGRIGGEVTEVTEVDMGAVVREAVGDIQDLVDRTGVTVTAGPLPAVRGERPLLVQLVRNLLVNSAKFRHPDRPPVVRLEARRAGQLWEFTCRDNGIGIEPKYAERVFVIFQRLHARDVYEGTGIGLAVCKKIVEYHGGEIWIDPDQTEGMSVRWTLPAALTVGTVDSGRAPAQDEREEPTDG